MTISAQEDAHAHAIPSWREVHAWAEREMLVALERLRGPLDPCKTAELRGRCAALDELSALPRLLAHDRALKAQLEAGAESGVD